MNYLAEFLGTAVLILMGNGVGSSVSQSRMFGNHTGFRWLAITIGWGLAVFLGVCMGEGIGGSSHLNPAVTIWIAFKDSSFAGNLGFWKIIVYIVLQLSGATTGQLLLNLLNLKHIKETDLGVVRSNHCTAPAFSNTKEKALFNNCLYEFIGTIVLIGGIWAIPANLSGAGKYMTVGAVVLAIGLSLGSSTGYAINPARDLGPRLVYYFTEKLLTRDQFGKNRRIGCDWKYGWVPVLMPSLAGLVMGLFSLIKTS